MAESVTAKRGRVVNEAELAQLADQAAAGFDLSFWELVQGGGPSLDPTAGSPSLRIAVRVPLPLYRLELA
ncbi:MAG: hypothetical protein ACYCZN_05845 [Candidatus Dormibacteria bacterium]